MPIPDPNVQAIDANSRGTLIALNDTTGLPERLRIEPITNSLLVYLVADDGLTGTGRENAAIDANMRNTLIGLNETTGKTECFTCDNNGVLKVTMV